MNFVDTEQPISNVINRWKACKSYPTPSCVEIARKRWAANRARKYLRKFYAAIKRNDGWSAFANGRMHMYYSNKGLIEPEVWLSQTMSTMENELRFDWSRGD